MRAVIGERLVTPGAFVQLVFKARVVPAFAQPSSSDRKNIEEDEDAENTFLTSKTEAEDMPSYKPQWSHAPHWPSVSFPRPQ